MFDYISDNILYVNSETSIFCTSAYAYLIKIDLKKITLYGYHKMLSTTHKIIVLGSILLLVCGVLYYYISKYNCCSRDENRKSLIDEEHGQQQEVFPRDSSEITVKV